MNRRTYVLAAGTSVSALLAGCTTGEDDETDENDENGDRNGDADVGSGSDESDELEAETEDVIDAYVEASNAEDEDAIGEVMHSSNPLHPAELGGLGFSFEPFDAVDPDDVEIVEVKEASADDVFELENAELWFEEDDLEAEIGDEEVLLAYTETGDAEIDRETDTWVLVTEDDEWHVFFVGTEDSTLEDPEELFEEPIEDEDEDVVATVEWDVDPVMDDFEVDGKLVEVQLTESRGIEADTVRIETTVHGGNMEFYDDEDGDIEVTWEGTSGQIEFDPDGDQLEVIAVDDGDEQVVHREHYEP